MCGREPERDKHPGFERRLQRSESSSREPSRWCFGRLGRDRIRGVAIAALLIWAGVVLVAETLGVGAGFGWNGGWSTFLIGAGFIALTSGLVRLAVPSCRRTFIPSVVAGVILLTVGLGGTASWLWAVALIGAGLWVLLRVLDLPRTC